MIFTSLLAALPLLTAQPRMGGPEVHWSAPGVFVQGQSFKVHVEITAPRDGTVVASWLLSPAAFTIDGKALGKREDSGTLTLPAGFKLEGDIDLGGQLPAGAAEFKLGYASEIANTQPVTVSALALAPQGLNFTEMPLGELSDYQVLLQTNRGDILVKFWPDVAPNHVRNFLDLAYIKFYDGVIFHRVMPGFMIQGGDPTGTGTGDGPRKLKAEFSSKNHLPGVLSMARGPSPDSASCQFFIMHGDARQLDGQYSAFGETVTGMDVVDKIANAPGRPIPGAGGNRPDEAQKIERALVVTTPKK